MTEKRTHWSQVWPQVCMLAGPFPSRVTLCKAFHLSMARFTFGGEQQEASGSIPGSRNINDEKNALL